jgi:hypothetical protein
MANNPLVGGAVFAIDSTKLSTTTKVSAKRTRNIAQKYGPLGPIGSGKGQYKITGTLSFAVPKAGLEVDLDALSAQDGGFSISFQKGTKRYILRGCEITDDAFSNDPLQGETDNEVSFTATEMSPLN